MFKPRAVGRVNDELCLYHSLAEVAALGYLPLVAYLITQS